MCFIIISSCSREVINKLNWFGPCQKQLLSSDPLNVTTFLIWLHQPNKTRREFPITLSGVALWGPAKHDALWPSQRTSTRVVLVTDPWLHLFLYDSGWLYRLVIGSRGGAFIESSVRLNAKEMFKLNQHFPNLTVRGITCMFRNMFEVMISKYDLVVVATLVAFRPM